MIDMTMRITPSRFAALAWLLIGACDCNRNTIPVSTSTVDSTTHDAYQRREPMTTGNPLSASGPQYKGSDDDMQRGDAGPPRHFGPP